jgi:RNA-dependent RNA polymerase
MVDTCISTPPQPSKMVYLQPVWQGGPPKDRDWSRTQLPENYKKPRANGRAIRQQPLLIKPPPAEWQKRPDFTIKMRTIHPHTTTYHLYQSFKKHGEIVRIEIFQNQNGVRDGGAKIRFAPPPAQAFWKTSYHPIISPDGNGEYVVNVSEEPLRNKTYLVQSPIRKAIFYEPKMKLLVSALHFGLMIAPKLVMPMHSVRPIRGNGSINRYDLSFVVDLNRRRIETTFNVEFKDHRSERSTDYDSAHPVGHYDRINKFKFWIPFDQLQKVERVKLDDGGFALVISLDSPPPFYRKREDEKSCHSDETCQWSEFDTWFRQTDIVYDPYRLQRATVTLHKERPVIDIGIVPNPSYHVFC